MGAPSVKPTGEVLTREEVYNKLAEGEDIPALRITKEGYQRYTADDTSDEVNLFEIFGDG